ncbi:MAG: response regulator [Rhodocyclaceae bacterium]|nr:response regulator [Rhodocyclaceae bacterium]
MSVNSLRPTLLLVDDESSNLAILREILKDEYRLLFAKDGLQALEIAGEHQPDLILCDVMMPNLDGFGTCKRLKRLPRTAAIPVIFVTALADDVNEAIGFEAGAVDYIYKPVSPPVLVARVRTHLKLVSAERLEEANAKLNAANGELAVALRRMRGSFESSIRMLSSILEHRNGRLAGYCHRAALLTMKVAEELGLGEPERDDIYHAALLHEIGKIGFPDDMLDKPQTAMNQNEIKVFKQHPLNAELILMPIEELSNASMIIRHQHERVDGQGFPDGLAGEAIPIGVSVLSATKFYLDLVMGRRGSAKLGVQEALVALRNQVGGRFPGVVVDALVRVASGEQDEQPNAFEFDTSELKPGMVLAVDWRNSKDVLLLAAGLVLNETMVRQLQNAAQKRGSPIMLGIAPVDAYGKAVERPDRGGAKRLAH